MKLQRRNFLMTGAALAAPVFHSCNQGKTDVIGVIPKGRSHLFWQSVQAGALTASKEYGATISWNGPATETDFNAQVQIIDSMINRKVSAICLAPIDRKAMVAPVERAAAAGIPVVIFDSGIETDKFLSQITTDNYKAGQLAGERMGELLGGKGKVLITAVQVGSASTMDRERGFEDAVRTKFPGIEILDKRYGQSDYAESRKVTENMLTAHPGANAIFASNESSSVGAVQALKARGSSTKLVGFDSSDPLLADLKKGAIDSLVVQDPFRMGYLSVQTVVLARKGGATEKIRNLDARLVMAKDLEDPAVKQQLHPDLSILKG
jgi:ribose transport system substrate-binding protein